MVQAEIKGLLAPDFTGAEAPPMVFVGVRPPEYRRSYPTEIEDARTLQSRSTEESAFFAEHAFVLLPHRTQVRDWDADVATIYRNEIAAIIRRRLLPGRRVEVLQSPQVVQRGSGGRRLYGEGVHCDGPLTPDIYARNLGAFASEQAERNWRQTYARSEVAGFMLVNFWRTIHMSEPLRHMPLALCDPNSVRREDIFSVTIPGLAPQGRTTHHLALRFDPGQRWIHYPAMTTDEVLVFKQCEFWKAGPDAVPQNVFHTAIRDPSTPLDAEARKSCEHRVGVMILRD
jgi:hypothetical protein